MNPFTSYGPFEMSSNGLELEILITKMDLTFFKGEIGMPGEKNPAYFIEDPELVIVLSEDENRVLYFEATKMSVLLNGIDITKISYANLLNDIHRRDENIRIFTTEFESPLFGLLVHRPGNDTEFPKTILIMSKECTDMEVSE